jgi:hypothetical protein
MDIILKSDYIREFISGFIAGISSTFIGHPFDTIKVNYKKN